MKIVDIKNVVRKDSPIHYINEYHSTLEYKINDTVKNANIEIIIEKTAFGTSNIQIHFLDQNAEILQNHIDSLTSYISQKHKEGYFTE